MKTPADAEEANPKHADRGREATGVTIAQPGPSHRSVGGSRRWGR